jgi:hypothetical protein
MNACTVDEAFRSRPTTVPLEERLFSMRPHS